MTDTTSIPAAPRVVALLSSLPPMLTPQLEAAGYRVVDGAIASPDLLALAEAGVARGAVTLGDAVFARVPRLRLLCCWGAGYDGVDRAAAARRGIQVANSPGANAASVADLAIGLLISLMRNIPAAERHLREGGWRDAAVRLPAARGLTGARLGLFGFGEIGRRVAARAQALEMAVGCFTRRPPDAPGVQAFADLTSLARWADALVIAVGADAATFHAVNAQVLEALGPQGYLVNVARGAVVNEAALCRMLQEGRLAGFASDVFEHEPQVPPAMLGFPNAVLTPHVGGATEQAQVAMAGTVLANLERFFSTGQPLHSVRPPTA